MKMTCSFALYSPIRFRFRFHIRNHQAMMIINDLAMNYDDRWAFGAARDANVCVWTPHSHSINWWRRCDGREMLRRRLWGKGELCGGSKLDDVSPANRHHKTLWAFDKSNWKAFIANYLPISDAQSTALFELNRIPPSFLLLRFSVEKWKMIALVTTIKRQIGRVSQFQSSIFD